MPVLTTAVGVLGLVNLLFLFGVIRRLREHTETLGRLDQAGDSLKAMPDPGTTIADFEANTVDGQRISSGDFAGTTLVGVFAPGCAPCELQLDPFVEYAAAHPGGRGQTLAVVVGEDDDPAPYIEHLAPAARVVQEPRNGPVSMALSVRGYPVFALVDDMQVRISGHLVSALPAAVAG
jgi:hypothetical protein